MKIIKEIGTFDKSVALEIAKVISGEVVDEATLILLGSNNFVFRLKGISSLLDSLSVDLLGKLEEESSSKNKDYIKLVEKKLREYMLNLES